MSGLCYSYIASPVGSLLIAGDEAALHFLSFPTGHKSFGPHPDWHRSDAPFLEARRQIDAYFAGDLRKFELPLRLAGTDFQNGVWHHLSRIAFGETRTYGQFAKELGKPKASRAVGAANGNNPVPIILPCHRVIGANGSLTGFGGGLSTKAFLLRHEGVLGEEDGQLGLFAGQPPVAP